MARPPAILRPFTALQLPAGRSGGKKLLRNNAQMWRLDIGPFRFRIGAAQATPGFGILDHTDAVPGDAAVIESVLQDTALALAAAIDGRSCPALAARRGHALGVQLARNSAGRQALDIGLEDPPYHVGFPIYDRELARLAGNRPIAIGAAAGMPSVADHAGLAAAHLVGEILEIESADQAANADLDFIGLAVMHRPDRDAAKRKALEDAGQVFLVARQAIERLDHDAIEGAGGARLHEGEKAVAAEDRSAGAGAVGIAMDDREAFLGAVSLTQGKLILDRAVALQIGGEAGINDGTAATGHVASLGGG